MSSAVARDAIIRSNLANAELTMMRMQEDRRNRVQESNMTVRRVLTGIGIMAALGIATFAIYKLVKSHLDKDAQRERAMKSLIGTGGAGGAAVNGVTNGALPMRVAHAANSSTLGADGRSAVMGTNPVGVGEMATAIASAGTAAGLGVSGSNTIGQQALAAGTAAVVGVASPVVAAASTATNAIVPDASPASASPGLIARLRAYFGRGKVHTVVIANSGSPFVSPNAILNANDPMLASMALAIQQGRCTEFASAFQQAHQAVLNGNAPTKVMQDALMAKWQACAASAPQ